MSKIREWLALLVFVAALPLLVACIIIMLAGAFGAAAVYWPLAALLAKITGSDK